MTAYSRPYLLEMSYSSNGVQTGRNLDIMCGATAISDTWVLTAAHCVTGEDMGDLPAENLVITAAEFDVSSWSGHESRHAVRRVIYHPQYDTQSSNNDIALLELATPMNLNDARIAAIPLNDNEDCPATSQNCRIMGWGTTRSGGSTPAKAREAQVPVVSNSRCQRAYRRETITDGMLCAGKLGRGGTDTCQGDSGGPFVCTCGDVEKHVGVVSWGYGCADRRYPGVYARTSHYLDWISTNTGLSKQQLTGTSAPATTAAPVTAAPATTPSLPNPVTGPQIDIQVLWNALINNLINYLTNLQQQGPVAAK